MIWLPYHFGMVNKIQKTCISPINLKRRGLLFTKLIAKILENL